MKALVFHRPGHVEVNDVDDPKIEHPEDILLRVTATAICVSDLHIYNGFLPQAKDMVLGHEFMGVVEETAAAVRNVGKDDRVVIPFPIGCGACFFCGADVCVDAVGMEADRSLADKLANIWHAQVGSIKALKTCINAVRRGGFVSVLGVYGIAYDAFPLGQIFDKGIRIAFGQAPVQKYIDELIRLLEQRGIQLDDIISHRLPLQEAPHACEIFNEKKDDCVKVVLKP